MCHTNYGRTDVVAHLLQDPRVRATVDVQNCDGDTSLHLACFRGDDDETLATYIVHLLLQAGANPTLVANDGMTPLVVLQEHHPAYTTTIALLEHALAAAEVTSLLDKARRLVVATNSSVIPPCLEGRVARGKPLPRVELCRLMLQLTLTGAISVEAEQCRKLRNMMPFILGLKGGPEGEGMPRDVFRGVLMDFLIPVWDPLRRKCGDAGRPQQQG